MTKKRQERGDYQRGPENFVGRKNAGRYNFTLGGTKRAKAEHTTVHRIVGEPEWDDDAELWTVPEGYKHPSCDTCGHVFYERKPRHSIGGASVLGGMCRSCINELENM